MDFIEIVKRLRPDVTWTNDEVNGHSLTTIARTYNSSQPIPTAQEATDEWRVIRNERRTVDIIYALKVKMFELTNSLGDPLKMSNLQSIRYRLQAQQDAAQPLDAHNGYVRINNINYNMTGENALQFLTDLEIWSLALSDFRNTREDELSGLSTGQIASYNADTPNGFSWPSMPDPNAYTGV